MYYLLTRFLYAERESPSNSVSNRSTSIVSGDTIILPDTLQYPPKVARPRFRAKYVPAQPMLFKLDFYNPTAPLKGPNKSHSLLG